jgi:predicted nucleotidyltransferase
VYLCSVWTAYELDTYENLTEISVKTCSIKINIVYSWQNGNNMATTNDYITILRKYLSTKADAYGITKIGIFGSVARNEQTEDSDVDVCVEMKKPDLFTMVHIKEELQELFGKPVDIVRLRNNMNPMLLKQINRDGIYA